MKRFIIKHIILIAFLLGINSCLTAQVGQWTWVRGADTTNPKGTYGLINMGDTANNPGGRRGGVCWTDTAGNFWLFGGNGYTDIATFGLMNDLWRYNKSTNTWTWVRGLKAINQPSVYGTKGIAAATNTPGARTGSVAWADRQGNLWLFGGITYDYKQVSDVWKYSIAGNQWTWVKGDTITLPGTYGVKGVAAPVNTPAGRSFANGWYDTTGKFYLFGGQSADLNGGLWYNDLWIYDLSANQWTWINGDSVANKLGVYGTQNQSSPTNKPGGRSTAVSWRDLQGNCWMMGGLGFNEVGYDYLNDLWKYDPTTNNWTWVKGAKSGSQSGEYGTLGVPSPLNVPGCRLEGSTWTDKEGNLWLLGGRGFAEASAFGDMNDLWKFDMATKYWVWMGGDKTPYASGVYGIKGQPSVSNMPGAREQSFTWKDESGNLWLMGGGGYGALGGNEYFLNDMWMYKPAYAIPVKLVAFTATRLDNKIMCEWVVENEQNFLRYELQRSNDAKEFSTLSIVKPGPENSNNKYSFADETAAAFSGNSGSIYYRLKMVDRDGSFSYSQIVHVALSKQRPSFTIYPNPSNTVVHLQFTDQVTGLATITITDSEGKVKLHKNKLNGNSLMSIVINQLPAGSYTISVDAGKEVSSRRLVIVR